MGMSWFSDMSIMPNEPLQEPIGPVARYENVPVIHDGSLRSLTIREDFADMVKADNYQLPAIADREGYYGEKHFEYWLSGLRDYIFVKSAYEQSGQELTPGKAVLELGCASGRVLRHFAVQSQGLTCFGCDVNRNHIEWMQRYLPNNVVAFQNTFYPALPMDCSSVDIVAAFSVFTHVDDFEDALLMELRRVLKPGGVAVLSVQTESTWESLTPGMPIYDTLILLKDQLLPYKIPEMFSSPMPVGKLAFRHRHDNGYACNTFHKESFIRERWGRIFDVVKIVEKGHNYQDCVVLRNRK